MARWATSEGLLGEFSLAKEQSDWNRGEGIGGKGTSRENEKALGAGARTRGITR